MQDKGRAVACQSCVTPFSQERCVLPYVLKCGHLVCGDCVRRVLEFVGDTTQVEVLCPLCSASCVYSALSKVPVGARVA